ncbi:MAG: hypothetical protein EOP84_01865 [Verrucomicrobiaceae bacterium]|nr:MAG: hypothetical protein EOP84_01865 [Verrucomicrobiaceae bacterium]
MEQQHPTTEPRSRKRAAKADVAQLATTPPSVALATPAPAVPLVTTPGWHELAEEAYHSDPCPAPSLSSHVAMTVISKSLMHAWRSHPKSPGFEPSVLGAAADRGSAAHALLFGGKAIEAILADDFRTAAARDARDKARAAGRIPMLSKDVEGLAGMIEPARQRFHDLHGGAFLCEQTAVWRDPISAHAGWRRARIDTVSTSRALIVDYKTTEGAVDALSCERRIADMGLQVQAAAYVDAVENLHPDLMGRVKFIFQWQEQKAPMPCLHPSRCRKPF